MRIALIHATPAAMPPVEHAFKAHWPETRRTNLLDDSLSRDRALAPDLTDALYGRFDALGRYALSFGADGILFTCSAFGPAIERVAATQPIPVLKPNEAMFAEALAIGGKIGMLATFEPSIPSMAAEFEADAATAGAPKAGNQVTLESVFVPGAMAALLAGKRDQLLPIWSPGVGRTLFAAVTRFVPRVSALGDTCAALASETTVSPTAVGASLLPLMVTVTSCPTVAPCSSVTKTV